MIRSIFFVLALLLTHAAFSQNRAEFFKAVPIVTADTPEWAQMMYSQNPNVATVMDAYKRYYKQNPFVKNLHTQNYKFWTRTVQHYLDDNGFIVLPDKEQQDRHGLYLKQRYSQRQQAARSSNVWQAMGPFETYAADGSQAISWHKNVYAIDQSLSDPDILIAGTEAGGVYRSGDKGSNWSLVTSGEIFAGGNGAVKIHPTDPDNFLVASNSRIYQSLDGGNTWVERHFTDGTGNEFQYAPANSNIIFHTSTTGLFRSLDGGISWTQLFTETCWDIDFHPTISNRAYLLRSNPAQKRSELFRSDDTGATWTLKENGWYVPADLDFAIEHGGKIGVTPAAPDQVYVCLIGDSKEGDQGWIGVYKSTNSADLWTNPTGQDGGPYGPINGADDWNVAAYSGGYHQGFFNFDLEVSPTDPDKFWIATIRLTESSDGGLTYQSIGAANSNRLNFIHADVQDIEVRGSDIWVASDGGINFSEDELMSHVALNKGIQAAHFWGFNTGWNQDSFTGGKYHDGTSGWYESYTDGQAYNIGGVEEASGYVHPIEGRKLLFRTHYASSNTSVKVVPEVFGEPVESEPSLPIRPNESYSVAERSGVYYDPRYANHIYVGLDNKIFKSTNAGQSFEEIFTFPGADGKVYEIEISRSNPDVLYCVYNQIGGFWDPCSIWKSEDGGQSWNQMASPTGNNRRFRISLHPQDEDTIWLCTPRGENGHKVFLSTDGGSSWDNKTTANLDGENLTDILYQGGTDQMVYVTSQYGVLYWDSATQNWIDYSAGLPLVTKSLQLNPFYRDAQLRLGSHGRGVFGAPMLEEEFLPVAQPITYDQLVRCPTAEVQFDCYSILDHQNASWSWQFDPEPLSVSSTSERNPVVVFGSEGSYDVTLTVTDANGNTSTKTIQDMVTVVDDCPSCESYGNMSYATAVTLVDLAQIYNQTGKDSPYTDYSDTHVAGLEAGSTHDLSVNVNTDGNYTVYAKVWIDWNQDLDYNDPNEEYDLGSATNTPDGPTSFSPLSITVPADAVEGETTMRVSAKYNQYPEACETDFDGEVEDYGIVVIPILEIADNDFEDRPVLFPNPNNGTFNIDMQKSYTDVKLQIFDVYGREVKAANYADTRYMDIQLQAASGVYFLTVESNGKRAVFKLLKE